MLMAIEARGWVLDPLVADLRGQQGFAGRGQLVMKAWESVTGAFCCLWIRCWCRARVEGESRYQPNRLYSASGGVVSVFCEHPQLVTCGILDCCFGAAADCFIWVHKSA